MNSSTRNGNTSVMKKFVGMVLSVAAMAFVSSSWADSAAEQQSATQLRALLDKTTTLQGGFEQSLFDNQGALLEKSSGDFVLKRPGKFYWNTTEPYEQILISDQTTIWLYDPDLEQVTVRSFNDDLQQTPALLLSENVDNLREHFAISRSTSGNTGESFVLTPKKQEGLFQTLTLVFAGKAGQQQLSEFHIKDNLGQLTRFSFSKAVANQPVSDAQFQFTPPDGVDVLYD